MQPWLFGSIDRIVWVPLCPAKETTDGGYSFTVTEDKGHFRWFKIGTKPA